MRCSVRLVPTTAAGGVAGRERATCKLPQFKATVHRKSLLFAVTATHVPCKLCFVSLFQHFQLSLGCELKCLEKGVFFEWRARSQLAAVDVIPCKLPCYPGKRGGDWFAADCVLHQLFQWVTAPRDAFLSPLGHATRVNQIEAIATACGILQPKSTTPPLSSASNAPTVTVRSQVQLRPFWTNDGEPQRPSFLRDAMRSRHR